MEGCPENAAISTNDKYYVIHSEIESQLIFFSKINEASLKETNVIPYFY